MTAAENAPSISVDGHNGISFSDHSARGTASASGTRGLQLGRGEKKFGRGE